MPDDTESLKDRAYCAVLALRQSYAARMRAYEKSGHTTDASVGYLADSTADVLEELLVLQTDQNVEIIRHKSVIHDLIHDLSVVEIRIRAAEVEAERLRHDRDFWRTRCKSLANL